MIIGASELWGGFAPWMNIRMTRCPNCGSELIVIRKLGPLGRKFAANCRIEDPSDVAPANGVDGAQISDQDFLPMTSRWLQQPWLPHRPISISLIDLSPTR